MQTIKQQVIQLETLSEMLDYLRDHPEYVVRIDPEEFHFVRPFMTLDQRKAELDAGNFTRIYCDVMPFFGESRLNLQEPDFVDLEEMLEAAEADDDDDDDADMIDIVHQITPDTLRRELRKYPRLRIYQIAERKSPMLMSVATIIAHHDIATLIELEVNVSLKLGGR